jgi:hypothetical protein
MVRGSVREFPRGKIAAGKFDFRLNRVMLPGYNMFQSCSNVSLGQSRRREVSMQRFVKSLLKSSFVFVVLGLLVMLTPIAANAGNIYYAWDYATLQLAIEACELYNGGLVIADAVTYNENIYISSDNVTLMGQGNATHISPDTGSAIAILGDQVTVMNLRATSPGVTVHVYGSRNKLSGLSITTGDIYYAIEIGWDESHPAYFNVVENVNIENEGNGGGIWLKDYTYNNSIVNTTIIGVRYDGIAVYPLSTHNRISGCHIGNPSDQYRALAIHGDYGTITGCVLGKGTTNGSVWFAPTSSYWVYDSNHESGSISVYGVGHVIGDHT